MVPVRDAADAVNIIDDIINKGLLSSPVKPRKEMGSKSAEDESASPGAGQEGVRREEGEEEDEEGGDDDDDENSSESDSSLPELGPPGQEDKDEDSSEVLLIRMKKLRHMRWTQHVTCIPLASSKCETVITPLSSPKNKELFVHLTIPESTCGHFGDTVFTSVVGHQILGAIEEYHARKQPPEDESFISCLAAVFDLLLYELKMLGQGAVSDYSLPSLCSNKTPKECVRKLVAAWREVRGFDPLEARFHLPMALKTSAQVNSLWKERVNVVVENLHKLTPSELMQKMLQVHRLSNDYTANSISMRHKLRGAVKNHFRKYNPLVMDNMTEMAVCVASELKDEMVRRNDLKQQRMELKHMMFDI